MPVDSKDIYLLLTSLIVWVGVWGFVWSLDARVARLRKEMREDEAERAADTEAEKAGGAEGVWPPAVQRANAEGNDQ